MKTIEEINQHNVKKILAEWSIGVGLKAAPYFQRDEKLPFFLGLKYNLADKLVLHKFRAVLGGRVAAASSGGSALSPEVGSFFCGIGVSIVEGYGLTETSPVMTVGHPEFFKYGTVGKPIPGVEVKIAEDGEILCRGHNVMKGYYKEPEATAEAIDKDGWFYSNSFDGTHMCFKQAECKLHSSPNFISTSGLSLKEFDSLMIYWHALLVDKNWEVKTGGWFTESKYQAENRNNLRLLINKLTKLKDSFRIRSITFDESDWRYPPHYSLFLTINQTMWSIKLRIAEKGVEILTVEDLI